MTDVKGATSAGGAVSMPSHPPHTHSTHQKNAPASTATKPGPGFPQRRNNNYNNNNNNNRPSTSQQNPAQQQTNLWTRTLSLDGRQYHFDLRENMRGRYLKITEVNDRGRRTILLPTEGLFRLVKIVNDAVAGNFDPEGIPHQNSNNNTPNTNTPEDDTEGQQKSNAETNNVLMASSNFRTHSAKRFFFDLMRTYRGQFLKIVEVQQNNRTVVLIPESGWVDVAAVLAELQAEMPHIEFAAVQMSVLPVARQQQSDINSNSPNNVANNKITLSSRVLLASPKKFYFDLQSNDRGRFCKIAEIQRDRRATVILPVEVFPVMSKQLGCFLRDDFETVVAGTSACSKGDNDVVPLASRVLHVNNGKQFFVDLRSNDRGRFLKLSEVKKDQQRHSVFLPQTAFGALQQALDEFQAVPYDSNDNDSPTGNAASD